MADPVTATVLGVIGIGSSILGGVTQAEGQKQQGAAAEEMGIAQQKMFNYQAAVAKINSKIDLQNADFSRNFGEIQAQQYGQKAGQERGDIIAKQGASNVQIGTGSAKEVVRSQGVVTNLDNTQIRANAAKVAYDYDVKSVMDLNQSTLDVMAGVNAKRAGDLGQTAGDINATASILGSVGSVSSKWLQGNQSGMWNSSNSGGGTSFFDGATY